MKEIKAFASASAIAQEVLQNIRTVTAFHGQHKEEERYIRGDSSLFFISCSSNLDSPRIWSLRRKLEFEKASTWVCANACRKSSLFWPSPSHSGNHIHVHVRLGRPKPFFRYGPQLVRTECEHYTGGTVIVVSDTNLSFHSDWLMRASSILGVHRLHGQWIFLIPSEQAVYSSCRNSLGNHV